MKRLLLLTLLGISYNTHAVVIAEGDSTTANTTFTTAAVTSEFHRPTQTWYVGLTNGAGNYALSKAKTAGANQTPSFSAIGSNADVTALYVRHLSLSTVSTNVTQPYVVFTAEATSATVCTTFKVVDHDGGSFAESAALEDANSDAAEDIVGLVATPTHVISAVKGDTSTVFTDFGDAGDDGLALTGVARASTPTFTYYDATNGTTTNAKALAISGTIANGAFGVANDTSAVTTYLDMIYNDDLKRVYLSCLVTGAGTDGNDSAFGVAIIKVDPDANTLSILGQCANKTTVINNNTRIVAFRGNTAVIALRKLAVMKTSTGFYYLIVNGSASTDANTRNEVYAVALTSGNGDDTDGTFAANSLATDDFTTQATAEGDIPAKTDTQALVGGGTLPIVANDADIFVSHMEAVGDTVYCAIQSDTVSATNAPGVYYSQAIFNEKGKIIRWTDWAKAAPFNLGNSTTDGSTKKIAIDATSGELWGIETGGTVVRKTEWTTSGVDSNSLVAQLNSSLSGGCFSAYDANQSITSLGNQTTRRYALFGGAGGKVVFAKINTAESATYTGIQRTMTTDFSAATALTETTISGDSSPVVALGYSESAVVNQGYFFAGTKNGLYAFGPFTASDLADLNAAPFSTKSWSQVTAVTGHVKKIRTTANQVYVLTRDTDRDNTTIADKVFRIGLGTSVAALSTNTVTLATSGTSATGSDLTTATLFYDIFPLIGAANGSDDKLLLATNDGIYQSNLAVEADTNQEDATWVQVSNPATDNITYDLLAGPTHTRLPSMAWSSDWTDNAAGDGTFTRAEWRQIVSDDDAKTVLDLPNAQFCSDGSNITSVVPTKYLWSDGARRFFIGIPATSDGLKNNIYVQPYRVGTTDWNLTAEQGPLADTALKTQDRFYWIQAIGATGTMYAGGNKGVVSLE